jgi:ABC-type nitrate/sulfonate/bicarbonate transport system substrate-binding protein
MRLLAHDGEVVVKLLGVLIITTVLSAAYFEPVTAQEKFRVASGGFSAAIHAVAWAAYEKKIFQKYGLVSSTSSNVEMRPTI